MVSLLHSAISAYSRLPSAYSALKNLGILQLPCEQKVETLVQSNNAKAELMRSWLQKNFQSMMSSQKSNRKKGDVSLQKSCLFFMTSYILQFLWQDLTLSYSIIGPHFAREKLWDRSFLYDCAMVTIKLFSLYKLRFLFVMKPQAIWCYWRCWRDIRHPNFQSKNNLVVCKTKVPSKLMEFSNSYKPEEDNKCLWSFVLLTS